MARISDQGYWSLRGRTMALEVQGDPMKSGSNPKNGGQPFVLLSDPGTFGITGRRKGDWCPGQSLKKTEMTRVLFLFLSSARWFPAVKHVFFWKGGQKMKLGPLTGHKPGQISSNKKNSTIVRTGILRSFFWEGSQFARKPGLWRAIETLKNKQTNKTKKTKSLTKSVTSWFLEL